MDQNKFINVVENITERVLEKKGLLTQEWHLGTVESVNGNNTLNVFIDGSSYVTPNVPCNPQYDFRINDSVWVQYVNGKQSNKFIPNRRAIGDTRTSGSSEVVDLSYVHNQVIASDFWEIVHNLGKFLSVTIVDSAGSIVYGDVIYVDENTITISFNSAFSGKAYLN